MEMQTRRRLDMFPDTELRVRPDTGSCVPLEGLWKGGAEGCRKVGKKGYGPDQRIDRDRILVIHRSYLRRRMECRPPSSPIPWPHPGRQP